MLALSLATTFVACGGSGSDSGPSVSIDRVASNTSPVSGTTRKADPSQRIVLYAKTDQWYVQPFRNAPFTAISDDGGPTTAEWTYSGPDIPPPGGEVMRFNLWLFGGNAPASGRGDHVVVTDFRFVP